MSASGDDSKDDRAVVQSLALAGLEVASVFDLLKVGKIPERAARALVSVYPLLSSGSVKDGVVRALSDPSAKGSAGPFLLTEFLSLTPEDRTNATLKWALGNALGIQATPADSETLLGIALDRRHGRSREMIVYNLAKISDPRAVGVLRTLLKDDDVCAQAIGSLARLKAAIALPEIRQLLDHESAFVRKEAAKAIRTIEHANQESKGKGSRQR